MLNGHNITSNCIDFEHITTRFTVLTLFRFTLDLLNFVWFSILIMKLFFIKKKTFYYKSQWPCGLFAFELCGFNFIAGGPGFE